MGMFNHVKSPRAYVTDYKFSTPYIRIIMDFVAYTTSNYKILSDIWYSTLSEIPIKKNIHLTIDDHNKDEYKFMGDFYIRVIEEKLKNLLRFEPTEEFVVSSDCDIQFFKDGDWTSFIDSMRKSRKGIFFMRDCNRAWLNGGFYIIKRDYFMNEYKDFVRRMLDHGISEYFYVDQCYINQHRDELDWEFISDEYITCSIVDMKLDPTRFCVHHAIWGDERDREPNSLFNKLKTMHRVKGLIKGNTPLIKIQGDYILVVAKYNENTQWTRKYAHVKVYDKFRGDLPNIGREAHTYLTYIVQNYDTLPGKVYFSRGYIEDENQIESGKYSLDMITKHCTRGHVIIHDVNIVFPKEKLDIKDWFHTYINPNTNLEEPIKIWWNSTFHVTREQIHSRSKDYYEMLLNLIPTYGTNPEIAHYFERSWYYIFTSS